MVNTNPLLEVKRLKVNFNTNDGTIEAVNNISFYINHGETLGIVGESGSGKTVTSLSIMRLIDFPGEIVQGEIMFEGKNLLKISEKEMCRLRGNKISMIFQEPMTSLNPVFNIGNQVQEPLIFHKRISLKDALNKTLEILNLVRIPSPENKIKEYPFQLSGGLRQRVMIGMGLVCSPKLIIADEPTTALDVTIQAQILATLKELKKAFNTALLLITHDLGVIAEMADSVVVMYCGKILEKASTEPLFENPAHPYTKGLLRSIPQIGAEQGRLIPIPGTVPNLLNKPQGCPFHPRCSCSFRKCEEEDPPPFNIGNGHEVSCWLYENGTGGLG